MGFEQDAEAVPVGTLARAPCRYARTRQGNNDVLAVSLIVIFFAVVVVVETFGRFVGPGRTIAAVFKFYSPVHSGRRLFSRRGPIRLEPEEHDEQERKPLSVRSDAAEPFLSEKPAL
jgi:hypothetical protein